MTCVQVELINLIFLKAMNKTRYHSLRQPFQLLNKSGVYIRALRNCSLSRSKYHHFSTKRNPTLKRVHLSFHRILLPNDAIDLNTSEVLIHSLGRKPSACFLARPGRHYFLPVSVTTSPHVLPVTSAGHIHWQLWATNPPFWHDGALWQFAKSINAFQKIK